jgi:biotin transport system substrate-specific component
MIFKSIIKGSIAIICIALSAQLTIHIGQDIPISGQTLAVLSWAFFLSPKEMFFVMIGYYLLGGIGLPIFADGKAGWGVLTGNSIGYFIGFLVAGLYVSFRKSSMMRWSIVFKETIVGTVIILVLGLLGLSLKTSPDIAWTYGVWPFLPGALIKALLGTVLVYSIMKYRTLYKG